MVHLVAHGSGDFVLIGAILLGALVAVVLAGAIIGLVIGGGLRLFVRGRHLFWMVPLAELALYFAVESRLAGLLGMQSAASSLQRTVGIVGVVTGAFFAAGLVAVAGRVFEGRPRASQGGPATVEFNGRPPQNMFEALREGFSAPVRGFNFMAAHPGLWRYAAIPVALSGAITLVLLLLLLVVGSYFVIHLHPRFPATVLGRCLEAACGLGLLLLGGGTAVGAGLLANRILCGRSYTKLAMAVDVQLGLTPDGIREEPWRQRIGEAARDLGRLAAINAGLLALNIVPVLGTLTAVVLGAYLDGFEVGLSGLEPPMSVRGMARAQQRELARQHRWQTIGLGWAIIVLNLVPILGSVLLATAAAGAVLLHRRLEALTAAGGESCRRSTLCSRPPGGASSAALR